MDPKLFLNMKKNYAIMELECLAIAWAFQKCSFFFKGCPKFSVITDHCPLLGIFSKPLVDIANPCLVRHKEKLMPYNFSVTWLKEKNNLMADALSQNPVSTNENYSINSYLVGNDGLIDEIQTNAQDCQNYQ